MIDIHNHLLPGIDDGAPDIATSVAMARIAVDDGIRHLVCTPHVQPGRFDNNLDSIAAALDMFRDALLDHGIPLQVVAAAEVHFGLEVMVGVKQSSLPFVGEWQGRKVLLLELPHGEVPVGAERLTSWLLDNGVLPLLAHPERNRGFIAKPAKLKPFLEQGCLLQLTASSLTGRFGQGARQLAEELLTEGLVTVMATDAHNCEFRPPILSEGVARACELIGDDGGWQLVQTNPWQMTEVLFNR